jgi:fructose-1,6-bisphosphatase/inositol monophosphatase family enzyme
VSDDLELAATLVRDAGELAARMLREGLRTEHKTSISDVVSAADHAAEELVVSRLRTDRPADGVVGEEGTNEPGARTWFVDPVDGTYNGVPVDVLADRPLAQLSVASYLHPTTLLDDGAREPLQRVWQNAATVRMLGSGSVELASVAGGRLGAWVQINSLDWDWLPGSALVTAAGGATAVFTASGHRWHVAGNRQVVDEIRALIVGGDGLEARLAALVADASSRIGCSPKLTIDGRLTGLPEPTAAALEAVLAEALTNAVRHAYAGSIATGVSVGDELVLTVVDDGVGPNDEPTTGTGLRAMAARAAALGGTFTVEERAAMGTEVTWTVPLG